MSPSAASNGHRVRPGHQGHPRGLSVAAAARSPARTVYYMFPSQIAGGNTLTVIMWMPVPENPPMSAAVRPMVRGWS